MIRVFLLLIVCVSMTACSFDGMFLHPNKIPANVERVNLLHHQTGENIIAEIGDQFQPNFVTEEGQSVAMGFQIESVLFDNEAGNTLNGWIMDPDSEYNGTTILFFHGNAGNLFVQYPQVVPLLDHGFRVFLIDYSGFGFSEGVASRDNVLKDGTASLVYIKDRIDMESEALVVYGQSLGGHLAATVGGQNPEKIDALIIEGAFSSHKDVAGAVGGFLGRWLVAEKYSGAEAIQEYRNPVLVIHSKEDETVPFLLGEKLFSKANEPKTFLETTGCHMCGLRNYTSTIVDHILLKAESGDKIF